MFLSYFTLLIALSLSAVAAWYSILGLTAIFASAVIPIIIMGTMLEVAKVTVTIWLHEYWHRCRLMMKIYLVPAVAMLMVITSLGVFGFLSKAHSDQSLVSGEVQSKIAIYDEKIKNQKENIETNRKALKQMDDGVDQILGRSTSEQGAKKAVDLRRSQQKERGRLLAEISQFQKSIAELDDARAPIAAAVRKVEAEVGPIKYIAAIVYGDNPDTNLLERAVRWVIILLVVVFDPLAIMMVLAATESLRWGKQVRTAILDPTRTHAATTDKHTEQIIPTQVPVVNAPADSDQPFVNFTNPKPIVAASLPAEHADQDDDEMQLDGEVLRNAKVRWKEKNPNQTLKSQRAKLSRGEIAELPWLALLRETNQSFGDKFPNNPVRGDTFIHTHKFPNSLHKFTGNEWIPVDRVNTDNYTYDTAYIDHLIAKIAAGEYDPDLLNQSESEQVTERLNLNTTNA